MASTDFKSLEFGSSHVTLRRGMRSVAAVACILGREVYEALGVERVWLDRRIHRIDENGTDWDGWRVSGAVSTVLTRQIGLPREGGAA